MAAYNAAAVYDPPDLPHTTPAKSSGDAIRRAVLAEREACAKLVENMRPCIPPEDQSPVRQSYYMACVDAAVSIRARTQE